jgi:alkanesulfonate monooxygenase SsuD/methylene tetrahydromethanopterin reductase-like flavin-dependent oxidoreductase (luciferase family)
MTADGKRIAAIATNIEGYGFESVWTGDHLLRAEYMHGATTPEPLTLLTYLASATDKLLLGTSVLIVPLRSPVWLLKQLGSLSVLAADRVLLGVGTGWDAREFAAAGAPMEHRRDIMEAVLQALYDARRTGRAMWGQFEIEPAPTRLRSILVGGGASATVTERGEPVRLRETVATRIARSDGWIIRSSATADMLVADLSTINTHRERLGLSSSFSLTRATLVHVVPHASRPAAVDGQVAAFRAHGWRGSHEDFMARYPNGTLADITSRLVTEARLGLTRFILEPVGDLDDQLRLIAELLLPALNRAWTG